MAYPKEIMDRAFTILGERRNAARNDYQHRLQVIAERAPEVGALQRELTGTSAAIARTILSGTDVEEKLAPAAGYEPLPPAEKTRTPDGRRSAGGL